ncbi:MAG: ABC transporter ATP-binding protein [Desulfarculaceae bacterium]|nr:ABC transporter ATP-binding protein [Desulfarculaceae bacterium]MCF8072644.1 ABC transporter ATP-binding protein [Desulfarculaceae bacterium]MCF8102523.1 ABC transporter ATP-binding protein [Desulfarculaceae bacterium]MCF8117974.1 ABC transporter ATP-binding protein [Desulfarculaceae bacterium]
MSGLIIDNLSKSFGPERVLEGVGFAVEQGRLAVLLGPSGCGKSTILRLVAGLEEPDAGSITLEGRDLAGLAPKQRDVAMVFQSYALYPHLDVAGNLAFPLRMQGVARAEIQAKVTEAARLLGIERFLGKKPGQLSGGQRQRVAIGRAIVRSPALFLFDEPLSNLDAQLRGEMRLELARLHRRLGTTMLYVTHDQTEALTLGDVIVLLDQGRVQQIGPPGEIYQRPANRFVAGFLGFPPMNFFAGEIVGREFVCPAPAFRLELADPPPPGPAVLGLRPEELSPGPGALGGSLELIERVGGQSVLHLSQGEARFTATAPAGFAAPVGEALSLDPAAARPHLFRNDVRIN